MSCSKRLSYLAYLAGTRYIRYNVWNDSNDLVEPSLTLHGSGQDNNDLVAIAFHPP